MSVLIGIPCYKNAKITRECLEAINGVDVLLIDNGSDQEVKDLIGEYDCHKIYREKNILVNPAWNLILEFFLESNYDTLIILSSDVVLHHKAIQIIKKHLKDNPDCVPLPTEVDKYYDLREKIRHREPKEVNGGVPGTLIVLTREQAKEVYPIPKELKLWFGDEYIYTLLKKKYKLMLLPDLKIYHYGSKGVSLTPNAPEIIEQDKQEWKKIKETLWGDQE